MLLSSELYSSLFTFLQPIIYHSDLDWVTENGGNWPPELVLDSVLGSLNTVKYASIWLKNII